MKVGCQGTAYEGGLLGLMKKHTNSFLCFFFKVIAEWNMFLVKQ